MSWSLFLSQYLWWHYHDGFRAFRRHVWNVPRLVWRLFAPVSLLRSLFVPFQRLQEPYRKQASFSDWAGSFVVNTLMRLLGAIVRLLLFMFGIVSFLLACVLAGVALLIWAVFPLVCLLSLSAVVIIIL